MSKETFETFKQSPTSMDTVSRMKGDSSGILHSRVKLGPHEGKSARAFNLSRPVLHDKYNPQSRADSGLDGQPGGTMINEASHSNQTPQMSGQAGASKPQSPALRVFGSG